MDSKHVRLALESDAQDLRPWPLMFWFKEGKSILDEVGKQWSALIDSAGATKAECARFLQDHAQLFLCSGDRGCLFAISGLESGTGLQSDFVLAGEGYDWGRTYTLVEVAWPGASLCQEDGSVSPELESALNRVRGWQKWIHEDLSQALDLLPSPGWYSDGTPAIRFRILTGRRKNANPAQTVPPDLQEQRIEIVFFDQLTDWMAGYRPTSFFKPSAVDEGLKGDLRMLNQAANPFLPALTGAQWRQCLRGDLSRQRRLTPFFLKAALQHLQPHRRLMEKFDRLAAMVDGDDVKQLLADDLRAL